MKEIGWQTYGVEISSKAVDIAMKNGHNVFLGNISDANYPDDFLDAITLNNVLEHISDPVFLLNETFRMLKRSRELIINVPNFSSFSRRLFSQYWLGLKVPEHLQHYTIKSLKRNVDNNKYKNIVIKGIYRKILWQNLQDYLNQNKMNKHTNIIYLKILILMFLSLLLSPLVLTKIGRNLCMFIAINARKG